MNDTLKLFLNRRSIRSYTGEAIPDEKLKMILEAGLLSESGHNVRAWEFIVVKEPEHLKALVPCKVGSGKMLEKAGAAIVVAVDASRTDIWVSDGSIALANMHLMADSLGLGSCYVNALYRNAEDGRDVNGYLKEALAIPDPYLVVGLLSVGIPASRPAPHTLEEADWGKIHMEKF